LIVYILVIMQDYQDAPVERPVLFFAILPSEHARTALADVAEGLGRELGGRPTPAEKVHLTLVYLGATPTARVGQARQAAGAFVASGFDLHFERLGYWPHNRIVWAGTKEAPEGLLALQGWLESALRAQGFELETRPYAPHITLVRRARQRMAGREIAPVSWRAERFCLMRSAASRYTVLEEWPLQTLVA
jgi:2'-5' RNA ligase